MAGSAAWGDYDNDGDLDIVLSGAVYGGNNGPLFTKIYHNNNVTSNIVPSPPSNLQTIVNGNNVTFSWDKSTDAETPQNGLTYNLVIGTSPGACDILSPMSDRNTGRRRIVNSGNAGHCNSWTIKNLADGQYYWSVQAIDNCFAGSNFATTKSFVIDSTFDQFTSSIALKGVSNGSAAWGDYDNDGYLDILLTGFTFGGGNISKIYHNDGNNIFTEQTSIILPGIQGSDSLGRL